MGLFACIFFSSLSTLSINVSLPFYCLGWTLDETRMKYFVFMYEMYRCSLGTSVMKYFTSYTCRRFGYRCQGFRVDTEDIGYEIFYFLYMSAVCVSLLDV